MATYNLIKNSFFESVTSSGTGNKLLDPVDLHNLVDGSTTSSGVVLTSSDILYLDVDMHQRIQVNGIFIYADDLTKLSNIEFYYKNHIDDDYYGCTKGVSTTYTATIPSPSAPRFVRCTISGVDITIHEFTIFNDETKVKFGNDGTADTTWLNSTPLGGYGIPQAIEIYNNSNSMVTAYTCVDYLGQDDHFIKISSREDGEYLGFEDNVVLGYDYTSWDAGDFDNVEVTSSNDLQLIDRGSSNALVASWLCSLPLGTCYYSAKPFGIQFGWAFDYVNSIIWALFYTGTSDTDGAFKLYKYIPSTNTWVYRCDLYNAGFRASTTSMTCDDVNVYVTMYYSNNTYIYKHDVTGTLGNMTSLGFVYLANYSTYRRVMVADYAGGIYLLVIHPSSPSPLSKFYADLSAPISRATTPANPANDFCLVHSTYTGNLYFCGRGESSKFIREYNVTTDIWYSSYFNYGERISPINDTLEIFAHDQYLYFADNSYGNSVYRYDISADTVERKTTSTTATTETTSRFIVTDPLDTDDDFTVYTVGVAESDWYYLYGYNTGFEQSSSIENIIPAEGTYISPMIYLDDPYKSSYFKVATVSDPGFSSVSKDTGLQDGTIEVRSSEHPLTPIDEIYWLVSYAQNDIDLMKYVVGTQEFSKEHDVGGQYFNNSYDTAVCRRTGKIATFFRSTYYSASHKLEVFNREKEIVKVTFTTNQSSLGAGFDGEAALWWYDNTTPELRRLPDQSITVNYEMQSEPYAIAPELNGTDCWFSERSSYTLQLVDATGNLVTSINLHNPYGVCSTEDLCCWVTQHNDPLNGTAVFKYNREGVLLLVVPLPETCYRMAYDHEGGFYIRGDNDIGNFYHYDAEGNQTLKITGYPGYDFLKGGKRGFVSYNSVAQRATYFSRETGEVLWTKSRADLGHDLSFLVHCPDIFSWDAYSEQHYIDSYVPQLPVYYDPVWYGNDNLPWLEVPKDGYFLPNNIQHQVKLTLRNFDGMSTPTVYSITMAPTLKVQDIPTKESRPMYVRSSIPADADFSQFDLKIKVWWSGDDN